MNDSENQNISSKLFLGISSQVLLMGFVSLFTDISSDMIESILPLFIFEIGGTAVILGLISGVTNASANIFKGLSGYLSDKVNKRKAFVVGGYTISNLSKPFIGVSPSWEMVLALKASDRFGKGLRTSSRDALISYYAEENRGKAFGIHRSLDTTGALVGSMLAFLLLFLGFIYRQIIFFSIIPGIIAIVLILFVKEVNPKKLEDEIGEKEKTDKISRSFIKLIIILGVIEFASLDLSFLVIRAADYISVSFISLIPIFYLISNIVYIIFSPINGSLSDKLGRKPIIILGLSILCGTSIILAFPVQVSILSLILIIIIYIFFGYYMASVDPISRAYVADLAGKTKRGRAYGLYYLSVGLISFAESIIFGLIYDFFSFSAAFIYGAVMLFICIIIFSITDFSKIIKKDK
ncbi:MAG: MFS transporter [Promethearchaeota archaeon]|nr:MAG: MFS transporter [Candidatus Lokiarchaeota archaeon]